MFLPLMMSAQNVLTPQEQLEQAQKQLEEAKKAVENAKKQAEAAKKSQSGTTVSTDKNETKQGWVVPQVEKKAESKKTEKTSKNASSKQDPKYLAGAVTPDANGKIEFVLNTDANGKSAAEIYEIVYSYMTGLTQDKNSISNRVAIVNKDEHVIANSMVEWLVFSNSFLALDRTEFRYKLVAKISDNSLQLTINHIYYNYEEGRSTGFLEPAENVITDELALTKKKNNLSRVFGKFRKGTIDRKDQIFSEITALLKQ